MFSTSFLASANAQEITWFEFDAPPYYILKGPNKNKGIAQTTGKEFARLFPWHQHNIRQGNFLRGLREIETKNNVCSIALLKTKAFEKFTYFSKPWIMVLTNGLNVRTKDLPRYQQFMTNGQIDISALIRQSDFKLGTLHARPYGEYLDSVIGSIKKDQRSFKLKGSSKMDDLLNLLTNRKRVDGVIGYAAEIQFFTQQRQLPSNAITYIPIKHAPQYSKGYVGCSKSPLGKEIIQIINKEIVKHRDKRYLARYLSFLTPSSQKVFHDIKNKSF